MVVAVEAEAVGGWSDEDERGEEFCASDCNAEASREEAAGDTSFEREVAGSRDGAAPAPPTTTDAALFALTAPGLDAASLGAREPAALEVEAVEGLAAGLVLGLAEALEAAAFDGCLRSVTGSLSADAAALGFVFNRLAAEGAGKSESEGAEAEAEATAPIGSSSVRTRFFAGAEGAEGGSESTQAPETELELELELELTLRLLPVACSKPSKRAREHSST